MDESKWVYVQTLQLKDPTISLIISILVGALGIDRFLIGDTGLGIAKLFTCGGLGIWALVDWFLIMGRTKEKNFEMFQQIVG
jgi:TM2 domain-containing membrane protein YozV